MKKIVSLILLGVALLSLGANGTDEAGIENEKVTELTMYLLGDKPKDFDLVYAEVNKKLEEKINSNLTVNFLSWADFGNKYPLLFAAGEDFDMIYTSNWAFYAQQSVKNGFLELTEEMIKTHAPQTWANTPASSWEQVKVGGKVFMLPYTKREFGHLTYMVRGDLRKKYGVDEIKTLNDFEKYLSAISLNETEMIPYDDGSSFNNFMLPVIGLNYANDWPQQTVNDMIFVYDINETGSIEVINKIEQPEFLEYARMMKTWKEKGYWSRNALVNQTHARDSFSTGKSASCILNLGDSNSTYMELKIQHPEWDVEVFDALNGNPSMANPAIQNGMAVNANSRNPEKSLALLDLFKNDRELYDLTNYGIEGKHWTRIGDQFFATLPDAESYPPVAACPWGWMSPLERRAEGGLPNYDEILETWEKDAITHPLQMFSFDDSAVKNEIAAVDSILNKYEYVLLQGFAEDTEETWQDFVDDLKKAGSDKVQAEMQRQIDAFMAE